VGLSVGLRVGDLVGLSVGLRVGDLVGLSVGPLVGDLVGLSVGDLVGLSVGLLVGDLVGLSVGLLVGLAVADLVGEGVITSASGTNKNASSMIGSHGEIAGLLSNVSSLASRATYVLPCVFPSSL
jgi:hypothetical protein